MWKVIASVASAAMWACSPSPVPSAAPVARPLSERWVAPTPRPIMVEVLHPCMPFCGAPPSATPPPVPTPEHWTWRASTLVPKVAWHLTFGVLHQILSLAFSLLGELAALFLPAWLRALPWGESAIYAVFSLLLKTLSTVVDSLVVSPLRVLYFNGPSFYNVGFWGGMAPADACASLTTVAATAWATERMAGECAALLERRFQSFASGLLGLLYFGFAALSLLTLWVRWLMVSPMTAQVSQNVKALQDATAAATAAMHVARPPRGRYYAAPPPTHHHPVPAPPAPPAPPPPPPASSPSTVNSALGGALAAMAALIAPAGSRAAAEAASTLARRR